MSYFIGTPRTALGASPSSPVYRWAQKKKGAPYQCFKDTGSVLTDKFVADSYCAKAGPKPTAAKEPSVLDKILGALPGIYGATYGGGGAQQPVVVQSSTPSWLLPVGIGVVALGAVLLLTRDSGPKKNPAGRRRRARRRRRSITKQKGAR